MRAVVFGVVVVSGLSLSAGAWAQSNPSAASIINSLTPHAGMSGGTRGIRPLAPGGGDAGHATASGTAVPGRHGGPAHQTATTEASTPSAPSVNLTVQFATDSAQLTPQAEHTLDELGRALASQQLSSYRFRVEGHTDTVGSPDHNQALSEARAKAVVDYLVGHFNLDRARLEAVGMGQNSLLVQTRQGVSEPRNRRVTVINLGA